MIQRSWPGPVDAERAVLGQRAVARPAGLGGAAGQEPEEEQDPGRAGSIQNDRALIRGNAMSGAPIWSGTT